MALPVWLARGQMTVRSSGSFIILYTDFGLQVRYDGHHLVEVTAPSSYAGRLCGMCGEFPGHMQVEPGPRATRASQGSCSSTREQVLGDLLLG